MKSVIICIIVSFCIASCGGMVGGINKYEYRNLSVDAIHNSIEKVYNKYPDLIPQDSSKYLIRESDSYHFIVKIERDSFLFECKIIPPMNGVGTELCLVTATKWGEVMRFASEMGISQRRSYKLMFEKHVLKKIELEM